MKDDRLYPSHILEAVERILNYTTSGKSAFRSDIKTQDAVIRNLQAHGLDPARKRGDSVRDFPRLTGAIEGICFDVMPEVVPIQWDHAVRLPVGRKAIRIVDFDGLLRLKLRAGGPQDLMDTAHLLLQHPEHLAKAREVATTYRLEDKLEMWLTDRRVRSKAEEEISRRQEGARNRRSDG